MEDWVSNEFLVPNVPMAGKQEQTSRRQSEKCQEHHLRMSALCLDVQMWTWWDTTSEKQLTTEAPYWCSVMVRSYQQHMAPVGTGPSWWPQSSPNRHCPDPGDAKSGFSHYEMGRSNNRTGYMSYKNGGQIAHSSQRNSRTSWIWPVEVLHGLATGKTEPQGLQLLRAPIETLPSSRRSLARGWSFLSQSHSEPALCSNTENLKCDKGW